MNKIENVLVAIDFTDGSRAALDLAGLLAHRLEARLAALHVAAPYITYEPLPAFPSGAPLDPERLRKVEEDLREFVTPAGSKHPLAEVVVREGDPADEILGQATGSGVDLLVLGTHGRRGFERWMLGSVTERVARRAGCSVLAVPATAGSAPCARVLCGLDLSDSSAETLAQAAEVGQALRADLTVLYVGDGPHWYEPGPASGVDVEEERQAVTTFARERLRNLVERHVPKGTAANVQVAFGRAAREIERVATESADLVVLGATSSRGVDRFFVGSTAQHVLRAGVRPVLLVRPPSGRAAATGPASSS
jgi:nucleotide-binding universal stress UspA family protein